MTCSTGSRRAGGGWRPAGPDLAGAAASGERWAAVELESGVIGYSVDSYFRRVTKQHRDAKGARLGRRPLQKLGNPKSTGRSACATKIPPQNQERVCRWNTLLGHINRR